MSDNKKTLASYPNLMLDWDLEKNIGVDPSEISSWSHQMIYWKCHKCGRSWKSQARNRMHGDGCTCDAMERKTASLRKYLVERDGSLAEHRPDLARQWHPVKNGKLTPQTITCNSTYQAWWIDEAGKEWKSQVSVRCRQRKNIGAPNHIVYPGYNDLATKYPELAAEWNEEKNAPLTPNQVAAGSNQRVWWCCRKGHEWAAIISSRVSGRGCPICNQERSTSFPEQAMLFYFRKIVPKVYNRYILEKQLEIDIYLPEQKLGIEYDGAYYHRSTKKMEMDARKNKQLRSRGICLIRVVEDGITPPPDTEYVVHSHKGQLENAIRTVISLVSELVGISFSVTVDIEQDRTEILEQYIQTEKENSIARRYPELLREWHTTKNGHLKPEYISYGSNKRLWWKCSRCGYEWQSPVASRARGSKCPVCTGNIVVAGKNDLCTTHPELVKEWNYGKNKDTLPQNYSAGSSKYVWWLCSRCGYEWQATISNRTRSRNCPRCIGKVTAQEESLAIISPYLATQWYAPGNKELSPYDVLPHSDKRVWWQCTLGHVWQAAVSSRVRGNGCPYCGNKIVLPGYNDLATTHPVLLQEWDYSKNMIQPTQIFAGSNKKVYWICSKGHSWQAVVANRARGNGCPYCAGKRTIKGENDLATKAPLLSAEWHPNKNKELTPQDVTVGSNRKVWWQCASCGFEWQAIVWSRYKGRGCPRCAGKIGSPI